MAPICISVVIPTYKRPQLLQKCLAALCNQADPGCGYEIMVVADGPDPDTESLVNALPHGTAAHLHFHFLPEKKGPAAARNLGWRSGSGELVVFTDDDCIPDPNFIMASWNAYQLQSQKEIVFTGRVDVPVPERPTDYEKNVAHLSTAEFVTANCACSRAALEAVNGFDEDFPAAWREDSDLQFRFLAKQIDIIPNPGAIVCHPARAAKWGVSLGDQRKSMFNALLFKKHPELYRKRISDKPVWSYYTIIAATIAGLLAWVLKNEVLGYLSLAVWIVSIASFTIKRLKGTNNSLSHQMEMIVTSLVIPYLSVYWTIRGALRYRVLFF